jgi:DNA-binding CsgD family transcriptional regulator
MASNTSQRLNAELVARANTSTDLPSFRKAALLGLQRLVGFDSAVYLSGPGLSEPPVSVNRYRPERYQGLYVQNPQRYLPELARATQAAVRNGGAYLDNEIYTASERGRMHFYGDIIRPQNITSQLVGHLSFRERRLGNVHLCRHGRSRSFKRSELASLLAVVPTLALAEKALRLAPPDPWDEQALERLTVRERQISTYICSGLRTQEIASLLGTSPYTVRNQLQKLFDKLGVSNRTELAIRLERGGAIQLFDDVAARTVRAARPR